jgi:hypothetical protein
MNGLYVRAAICMIDASSSAASVAVLRSGRKRKRKVGSVNSKWLMADG